MNDTRENKHLPWPEHLAVARERNRHFEVRKITLWELFSKSEWRLINGIIDWWNGKANGFFFVEGAVVLGLGNEREVRREERVDGKKVLWRQILLREVNDGLVILPMSEGGLFLLTAKPAVGVSAEKNYTLYFPGVATSLCSFVQGSGGNPPVHAELAFSESGGSSPEILVLHEEARSVGLASYRIELVNREDVTMTENDRWCTPKEVAEIIMANDAGTHLVNAFALWGALELIETA